MPRFKLWITEPFSGDLERARRAGATLRPQERAVWEAAVAGRMECPVQVAESDDYERLDVPRIKAIGAGLAVCIVDDADWFARKVHGARQAARLLGQAIAEGVARTRLHSPRRSAGSEPDAEPESATVAFEPRRPEALRFTRRELGIAAAVGFCVLLGSVGLLYVAGGSGADGRDTATGRGRGGLGSGEKDLRFAVASSGSEPDVGGAKAEGEGGGGSRQRPQIDGGGTLDIVEDVEGPQSEAPRRRVDPFAAVVGLGVGLACGGLVRGGRPGRRAGGFGLTVAVLGAVPLLRELRTAEPPSAPAASTAPLSVAGSATIEEPAGVASDDDSATETAPVGFEAFVASLRGRPPGPAACPEGPRFARLLCRLREIPQAGDVALAGVAEASEADGGSGGAAAADAGSGGKAHAGDGGRSEAEPDPPPATAPPETARREVASRDRSSEDRAPAAAPGVAPAGGDAAGRYPGERESRAPGPPEATASLPMGSPAGSIDSGGSAPSTVGVRPGETIARISATARTDRGSEPGTDSAAGGSPPSRPARPPPHPRERAAAFGVGLAVGLGASRRLRMATTGTRADDEAATPPPVDTAPYLDAMAARFRACLADEGSLPPDDPLQELQSALSALAPVLGRADDVPCTASQDAVASCAAAAPALTCDALAAQIESALSGGAGNAPSWANGWATTLTERVGACFAVEVGRELTEPEVADVAIFRNALATALGTLQQGCRVDDSKLAACNSALAEISCDALAAELASDAALEAQSLVGGCPGFLDCGIEP
jgi:hypothetical protein